MNARQRAILCGTKPRRRSPSVRSGLVYGSVTIKELRADPALVALDRAYRELRDVLLCGLGVPAHLVGRRWG